MLLELLFESETPPVPLPTGIGIGERRLLTLRDMRRRGWTVNLVERLLPCADCTEINPRYPSAGAMRLYALSRVNEMEDSDAFAAAMADITERRARAIKAASTHQNKVTLYASTVVVLVPVMPLYVLLYKAMEHYNASAPEFQDGERRATVHSNLAFLARISVNYLRGLLGHLDEGMLDLYGRPGLPEAFRLLHERVIQSIGKVYPVFHSECQTQLDLLSLEMECDAPLQRELIASGL